MMQLCAVLDRNMLSANAHGQTPALASGFIGAGTERYSAGRNALISLSGGKYCAPSA